MLKNYAVTFTHFKSLQIKDLGEETALLAHNTPRQRPSYIIHFILDGEGVYKTSNSTMQTENKITKGQAFVVYKNDVVLYRSNPEKPLHYCWINFDGEEGEQIVEYIGFSRQHPTLRFKNTQEIVDAFSYLFSMRYTKDKYTLGLAFFALVQCLRKNTSSRIKNTLIENDSLALINAEKYISSHIHENLTIDAVAESVHLTRSHFSRLFKKRFGITPHEYIVRLRLQNAELLLSGSDYSITQIVDALNFTDIYSFSKLFKKYYRQSPSSYRKNALKNKSNQ